MPFKKGDPNINRKGRIDNPALTALNQAIAEVEKKQGKPLFNHFIEEAYKDKNVLIAVMKKKIPDLASTELKTGEDGEILIKIKGSKHAK